MKHKQPLTDGPFLALAKKEPTPGLRFHAYLQNGGCEKEFKASSAEQLREFVEVYWLNGKRLPNNEWKQMCTSGRTFFFHGVGTILIQVED